MNDTEKLRAELIATQQINQQIAALLFRWIAAREGSQDAFELLDLIDQQVPLAIRNVAMRERIPAEVARHADNTAADMAKNLREHLTRALADDHS